MTLSIVIDVPMF